MQKKVSLLKRAWVDKELVVFNLKQTSMDEVFIDMAAYHLQQFVEKMLKFVLNEHGIVFKKTHEIDTLLSQFDDSGIAYPDWIFVHARTLTDYATQIRFGDDFVGSKCRVSELLELATEYYEDILKQQELRQVNGHANLQNDSHKECK